jgi:hypothetical protein
MRTWISFWGRGVLILCIGTILSVNPALGQEENLSLWLSQITKVYREAGINLPALPVLIQGEKETSAWLLKVYKDKTPGSMEATSVAYWGAMRLKAPNPWIARMLVSKKQMPRAKTQEQDAFEALPEALRQIYLTRQNTVALEALVDLHADGAYQEILDSVRFPLFFQRAQEFVPILQKRAEQQPWSEEYKRLRQGFTDSLVYALSFDTQLRHQAKRLRDNLVGRKTSRERFLHRYIVAVLEAAMKRAKMSNRTKKLPI